VVLPARLYGGGWRRRQRQRSITADTRTGTYDSPVLGQKYLVIQVKGGGRGSTLKAA
jgi:hypothetical protein